MNWQVTQLKYALGLGGMMSFYGIVGLAIFLLPPNMVSNQYKIVVIALVLLTLPFALIIMFVASRREKRKAKKEAEAQQQAVDAPAAAAGAPAAAPVGTFATLTSGTEEAVQFLKTSNLGATGRDAVYSLPWYLVAGAPRAGKSSLVLSSNLNFQTLPSQRQSEQKFIRPTGSIDWRVTSDAVFVDTAGRYQSEGIDSEEWASLLETIKKYRGNRPVDGFLLVVNTETILKSDEREMEELAKVLRARLDDSMQRLKVRFPVYVVFTHADAIEGFRDSFSSSKNEDKTLVWGATIPIEKSENAQALFDGEYELLHNSLMKRRIVRLSAPFPPVRQLRIFNFPLHFGSARRKFGAFINSLFRPNPFSENPFLRGFYFTASPVAKTTGNAPATVGNSYFTERFFRDVVLRDKDLVKTQIESRQRPPIFGWLLTILGGLFVFALLVMAGISLASNKQLLDDAQRRGESMRMMIKADGGANPLGKKEEAARAELNQTDDLRQLLTDLDDYDRNGPPWYMRMGLYSGKKIYRENLLPMYINVVEARFKEPTKRRLEEELQKFAASKPVANPAKLTEEEEKNLERHLNLLKAYLMVSGSVKQNAEPGLVATVLKDFWLAESKIPTDMRGVAEQQLIFWAKQMDREQFPGFQVDPKLVAATRAKLEAFPAEYRYLSRKVTEISRQIDDATAQKTTVEGILRLHGADDRFLTSTYVVPSAYTRPGLELMKVAIANADEEMKKDDWVMGDAGKANTGGPSKRGLIEDRYYRDYAMHWNQLVRSTEVKRFANRTEAAEVLQVFSQPSSPLKILLREVAKQTNLSEEPESDAWWPWIKGFFIKKGPETGGSSEPEKMFKSLFPFVGKKDQANTQVDKYLGDLGRIFSAFNSKAGSDGGFKKVADQMAADEDPLELRKREGDISSATTSLNDPGGREVAALLMKPILRLRSLLGAGLKEQVAKTWAEQILPAAKEIEKGYPFEGGDTDADLKNLSAFLAPKEGRLSKFYDEKLSNYFEEANGQYRVKEGSELQFTDEFVAYLNNAFALQKALFGTGTTLKFEYEFVLKPVKDATIEVIIDGKKTSSEGTGSLKGIFPGDNSAETGVIVRLASNSGPAPADPSANPSNSNVSATSGSPSGPGDKVYQGQWGLFKFVDDGGAQKQPSGEYALRYTVNGKAVTATIKASGGDPFNKNLFRQVKAPQNFLK